MSIPKKILDEVLALPANGKVELVDVLLASLEVPDKSTDQQWEREVEDRIAAYHRGEIKALKIEEVLRKYK